ncbi:MAG TPA: hypothetical protein VLQ45_26890 [Thermoanaerobaculia bacterium]|nr:hypothetical protein [Thermoanaerobaculia bacterium]
MPIDREVQDHRRKAMLRVQGRRRSALWVRRALEPVVCAVRPLTPTLS